MTRRWPVYLLFGAAGGLLGGLASCGGPTSRTPDEGEFTPGVVRAQAADEPPAAPKPEPPPAPESFHFPDDAGGLLLAKLLPPSEAGGPSADRARGPRRPTTQKDLDAPALPLPPTVSALPSLPASKRQSLRPRLILEESLDEVAAHTPLPQAPVLPAGERVRVASPDVNQPVPLPVLARPVTDRAPVEDVTGEASAAAAVAAPIPRRTRPAPFLKLTVPDPYEHRRPLGLPVPPEGTMPEAGSPQLPKR